MEEVKRVKIIAADRLDDSLIIAFSDGRSGLYSSQLLHSILGSARELYEADTVEAEMEVGLQIVGGSSACKIVRIDQ